jgi:hypothetical protein
MNWKKALTQEDIFEDDADFDDDEFLAEIDYDLSDDRFRVVELLKCYLDNPEWLAGVFEQARAMSEEVESFFAEHLDFDRVQFGDSFVYTLQKYQMLKAHTTLSVEDLLQLFHPGEHEEIDDDRRELFDDLLNHPDSEDDLIDIVVNSPTTESAEKWIREVEFLRKAIEEREVRAKELRRVEYMRTRGANKIYDLVMWYDGEYFKDDTTKVRRELISVIGDLCEKYANDLVTLEEEVWELIRSYDFDREEFSNWFAEALE